MIILFAAYLSIMVYNWHNDWYILGYDLLSPEKNMAKHWSVTYLALVAIVSTPICDPMLL